MKKIMVCKKESNGLNTTFDLTVFSDEDIILNINIDDETELEEVLRDKELFKTEIETALSYADDTQLDDYDIAQKKWFNYLYQNFNSLLDFFEYIEIFDDEIDKMKLVSSYPILKQKKLLVSDTITLTNFDLIDQIIKKYEVLTENLYFNIEGNELPVNAKEAKDTAEKIKCYAEYINNFGLSPLEKVLLAYDMVRSRIYKEEKSNEKLNVSRDLTNVLFGENIVCAGFTAILNSILKMIGIPCKKVYLYHKDDEDRGHVRTAIYLQDKKYKINGIYFLDSTWDSRRSLDDQEFTYRYKNFLTTIDKMYEQEKGEYIYEDISLETDKKIRQSDYPFSLCENEKVRKYINFISEFVYGKGIISLLYYSPLYPEHMKESYNKDEINKKINKCINLMHKPISAEVFVNALFNVRKLEYYIDADSFPLSLRDLYIAFVASNKEFKKSYLTEEQLLLLSLFGKTGKKTNDKVSDFKNYCNMQEIPKKIEQVKLTKCLRTYLHNK